MAIWLRRTDNTIDAIRIAVGPSGPKPFRARSTERYLCGQTLDAHTLAIAKEILSSEARFRTSPHRASSAYRLELCQSLLEDNLETVWKRAGQHGEIDQDRNGQL
jgi:CO/xanthine dehydrogenase FAD-binding subunit